MKLTKIEGDCPDKINCPTVYATDRSTIVVRGYKLLDSEALAQLGLPDTESVVEVPLSLWEGRGSR